MSGSPKKLGKQTFSFGKPYQEDQLSNLNALASIGIPRVVRVSCWIIFISLVIGISGLWIPWVQTTSGSGQVTTLNPSDRVQSISALVTGRIAEWYVQDADYVEAGDPIIRIQDIDDQLIVRLQLQLDAARRKIEASQEAVTTAQIDYQRQKDLFAEGLASQLSFEQARIKVQQMTVSLEEARSEFNQAETALSRQGSQLVVAPRNGTIIHVEAGDTATIVSAGQPLATFMPADTERAVEIMIDGRDIGLVHPGRQVRLQFEGWPAFQFSGRPDLAVGTFRGEVVFVEPSARLDGRFRVLVKEPLNSEDCLESEVINGIPRMGECGWPPESFVRLGATVRGWILLETVPLGFELWRLLNSFPPINVTNASSSEEA
ncbi:HlyD family efflux transporter periplasmic adaptor subunit [Gammaproteobacteria bacterium]|nr:HlyD family efflux transporter periplasmic adaptor subunit [Gammaproteobacteria bacterium]MDA9296518.1 HlyD family efflux transporter periplasmic adaptor subunit [Gammaproteobacteria bacterium]MDC1219781.1 HlyD family efflux transporter periplasmic adaptor subunit [Gammaproteobacteria bacterium]